MCDRTLERRREVQLPEHVVDEIEARLPRTRFESVDAYVTSAIEMLLEEVDGTAAAPEPADGQSAVEDDDVRDQLESLGYL